MDVHTPEQRSYNMSRIQSKNTKPEKIIRNLLWHHGYRYRLHSNDIPGKPDIAFKSKKKVIFINGCYWHKHDCHKFKWPKTNKRFWKEKIERNALRDEHNYIHLTKNNWQYMVIWECEIKSSEMDKLINKIQIFLDKS